MCERNRGTESLTIDRSKSERSANEKYVCVCFYKDGNIEDRGELMTGNLYKTDIAAKREISLPSNRRLTN